MQVLEMMKNLLENPHKKFRSAEHAPRLAFIERDVLFITLEQSGEKALDLSITREWEEVKEVKEVKEEKQVTFIEAVIASEKRIRVEYEDLSNPFFYKTEYNYLESILDEMLGMTWGNGLKKIILHGKWYIED